MYSKEEASKLREQFWIAFGKYMKPVPSATGLPINWVNYKTGVKHIAFRMMAEQKFTTISIAITHQDPATRKIFYEQFMAFKTLFKNALNEDWEWLENTQNEYGVPFAQISKSMLGHSIYDQQQWPQIISFIKPRIMALDQFWEDVKPTFEDLA